MDWRRSDHIEFGECGSLRRDEVRECRTGQLVRLQPKGALLKSVLPKGFIGGNYTVVASLIDPGDEVLVYVDGRRAI